MKNNILTAIMVLYCIISIYYIKDELVKINSNLSIINETLIKNGMLEIIKKKNHTKE